MQEKNLVELLLLEFSRRVVGALPLMAEKTFSMSSRFNRLNSERLRGGALVPRNDDLHGTSFGSTFLCFNSSPAIIPFDCIHWM